jgi:hypothetical protein
MIEFQLQADSRILRAILPKIEEAFALMSKHPWHVTFPCPTVEDEDLASAWDDSLGQDFSEDRIALAKLLRGKKLPHGYVELEEEAAESAVRGLSELRLIVRQNLLAEITDGQLERGNFDLEKCKGPVKLGYFSYLILAEIQENLISCMG